MVPELRIIDKDFNLVGILDTYTSFQGERALWEVGRLELHVDLRAQGADACQIGNIVMIDERRAWEITGVRKTEADALTLMVTGRELKGILGQRIVVPQEKDDSHFFGWDRKPNDDDRPPYEQTYGESSQERGAEAEYPTYLTYIEAHGHKLYSLSYGGTTIRDEITTEGKLIKRIGIVEYDGTEDWRASGEVSEAYYHMDIITDAQGEGICASSIATQVDPTEELYSRNSLYMLAGGGGGRVRFRHYLGTVGNTASAFKSWLAGQQAAGTPITVWYELKAPIETQLAIDPPGEPIYGESSQVTSPRADNPKPISSVNQYGIELYSLTGSGRTIRDEITDTGLYIKRIQRVIFNGNEDWLKSTAAVNGYWQNVDTVKRGGLIFSNYARYILSDTDEYWYTYNVCKIAQASDDYSLSFPPLKVGNNLTAFKSWLAAQYSAGTPVIVYYELNTPTETQLPPLPIPEAAPTETVIKHYIKKHAVDPVDGKRAFPGLEIAPDLKRGPMTRWSERFRPLTETLKDVGEVTGMGYAVAVDLRNKRFVVDVIPEVDQTPTGDYPVILALDFENIQSIEYTNDICRDVSIAYAGGAGEDEDRLIQTVARTPGDAELEGYDRREAWLECGSVDDIDDLIFEAQYQLAQQEKTETLTCQALPNTSFEYLKDWDLGSIVTVRSRALGFTQAQKITAVKEVYERGRMQVIPTLGKRSKTILDEIRKVKAVD